MAEQERTVKIEVLPRRYVSFNDPDMLKNDGDFGMHRCLSCIKVEEVGEDGKVRIVWRGEQEWVTPDQVNKWLGGKKRKPSDPERLTSPPLVKIIDNRTVEEAKAARIAAHESGPVKTEKPEKPKEKKPAKPGPKPKEKPKEEKPKEEKPKADEPKTKEETKETDSEE